MPVARTPLWLYQDMGQVMDGMLSPVQFSCWRSFPETNCSKSFGHFWKIHASEEVAYICVFVPVSVCLSFIRVSFSPHIIPSGWLDSKHELKKWIDFKLVSHCLKSLNGAHLPLRPSSFLHPFSAGPFFRRHWSVQNTIFPHKVQWSALFLLPGFKYLEPTPCFHLSCFFYYFFQIFLERKSIFTELFSNPLIEIHVRACVRILAF